MVSNFSFSSNSTSHNTILYRSIIACGTSKCDAMVSKASCAPNRVNLLTFVGYISMHRQVSIFTQHFVNLFADAFFQVIEPLINSSPNLEQVDIGVLISNVRSLNSGSLCYIDFMSNTQHDHCQICHCHWKKGRSYYQFCSVKIIL